MKTTWTLLVCLIGLSAFAQEPNNQPTNLQFQNVKAYVFDLSFSPSDAEKYLVVRSTSPLSFIPQDGQSYQLGQGVGNGKVFSVMANTFMSIREVVANTKYYFTIFGYNGTGANIAYKKNNPLTGSVTSAGKEPGSYYSGLNLAAPSFLDDLKFRLNSGRQFQSYSDYDDLIVLNLLERDTINGQKVVNCQYSGETKVYMPPFSFVPLDYSREHALCRSWMPTGGSTSSQEGADYHNLILTQQSKVNAKRSNNPYGIVANVTYQYLQSKLGTDAGGNTVYEPRESIKGDAARNIFYQIICYNNLGGQNWGFDYLPSQAQDQDLNVLLTWHIQDPVSPAEIAHNEYVYSLQKNRNPFIDYPDWVDCIDFNNVTIKSGCLFTFGNEESAAGTFAASVYPNPAVRGSDIHIQTPLSGPISWELLSMQGQTVQRGNGTLIPNTSAWTPGFYILVLRNGDSVRYNKISIVN
ncbi:MAG: endonuclease [Flavobacteriales bacterium]